MYRININNSINRKNDLIELQTKLTELDIKFSTDIYGIIISINKTNLATIMELLIGKPILFSIID